jgi:ribonuclease HI
MDNIDENAINIFTDGSSYQHPRKGGMGIRFVTVGEDGHEVTCDYQPVGVRGANNQQMELLACSEALKLLTSRNSPIELGAFQKIIINTDSMYVVDNFNNAKFNWPKSRWLTRDGTPVANTKLWKDLVKRATTIGMRAEIRWVKGHKASLHNRAADKLAKGSAKQATRPPVSIVSVRRKKTKKSVLRGSVPLSGQRLTIRVITNEYLRQQRCYKYMYEVMSKASPYFGNVDVAYSDHLIRDGHTYYVLMGVETRNPRIVKVYREVVEK